MSDEGVETSQPKLAIIDGKSVFYRGYYAMPNLSLKDGTPTGGVFGFASMALEVLKRLKPDYVCVAWDKPKTNIRRRLELYPEYKAGRKPAPPDFQAQIPVLHELLEAFGWPLYELDDYEADDIMGTLATKASAEGIETMLVTSDLDMLQLVDPHIHVFALKKGLSNIELYSPASFEAKYGLKATQFLDLKALQGDSSDNIPGVPGIGQKGAIELLKQFETLDGVYANAGLLRDTLRRKLEAGKDLAYLSRELAAIWTDAPVELELDKLNVQNCEPGRIRDILQRLEFRSLLRQLPEAMQLTPTEEQGASGMRQAARELGQNIIVDSDAKLAAVSLPKKGDVVVHVRVAGRHGKDPQLLIISAHPHTTYTFNIPKLNLKSLAACLMPLASIVGHDTKATLKVLLQLGLPLPSVAHDVQIGAFLINSLQRDFSLTQLAQEALDYQGASLDDIDTDELSQRAPEITAIIRSLATQQQAALAKLKPVAQLATQIEWPIIPVLAGMECTGIKLNVQYLADFATQIDDTISDLEQQIYGHANHEFNIASPAQLAEVLFSKISLPTTGIKRGKTGYSTAASELDKLRGLHPIIELISQYREVTKLKNTYVDTLPKTVDEHSRVHTTFNLTVAQTGRLSSADPNLQNIPTRTELGRRIRQAFVAGPGSVLINADYSQFELRLAAALSGDQGMIEAFNQNADIHVATAAAIYGIAPEQVTKQQRYSAKAVNFGIMYGQGPHGLSAGTGMSFAEAKDFIERYFHIRPQLKTYIDSLRDKAKNDGYVQTLLGRRRPTPDVNSSNFAVREAAYRAAVNMPIQGTAADLTKLAMIKLDKKLVATSAQQLLQIHDSILLECAESEAPAVAKLVQDTMQSIHPLPVKLVVDTTVAPTWGDL